MKAIIVGAGIAGLSASIGLRRAGHRVTVGFSAFIACFLLSILFITSNI